MAIDKSDYRRIFDTVFTQAEKLLLNAKEHPDVLACYLESWLEIAKKATELNNPALQDVILLFIDASSSAFKKTKNISELTNAQWQLLKKWDSLFAHYIDTPDNQQIALALIQCLNDPLLAMGLEPEDEQMLLEGFFPVIQQLNPDEQQEKIILHSEVTQNNAVNIEPISLWKKLNILFREVELNLQEVLIQQINISTLTYSEALKHYLESWDAIVQVIDAEKNATLSQFLEIIFLFIDFNHQLFNQTDNLTNEQQAVLKQWHYLFNHYIETEGSPQSVVALVKCLNNSSWIESLSEIDEQILLEVLALNLVDASTVTHNALIVVPIAEQIDEISEISSPSPKLENLSFVQQIEPFFNQTTLHLTAAIKHLQTNNEVALKESLQYYLESWLAIAQQIEIEAKQLGLLDVVLLFIEVTRQAFEQLKNIDATQLTLLHKWQRLFSHYLEAQGNEQLAIALIQYLSNPIWSGAITPEDEKMLLANFAITPEPPSEFFVDEALPEYDLFEETEFAIDVELTDDILELSEELVPEKSESDFDLFYEDDNKTSNISEQKVTEQSEKQVVWQNFALFFDDAALQIQAMLALVTANNYLSCREYLQQYSDDWLMIAEMIAENEHLQTLADVSLLFADNCMAWVEQNVTFNDDKLALLQMWHTTFADYFQDTSVTNQINALIDCLENNHWLHPLTVEDKEMLLAMLATDIQKPARFINDSENVLTFDEYDDFPLFADEEESEQTLDSLNTSSEFEDFALFADESLPDETDFALFADEEVTHSEPIELKTTVVESDSIHKNSTITTEELSKKHAISVNPELISMVRDEFALLVKDIHDEMNAATDAQTFKAVLKNHEFKFENLAKACNTIGLLGLEQVFEHLSVNIRNRSEIDTLNDTEAILFKDVLPLIQNYLNAMTERNNALTLLAHLAASGWKQPLTETQIKSLLNLLTSLVVSSHKQQLETRKTVAELADISLKLPDDVNRELLDALLNELPILINNFSAVIQKIISGKGHVPQLLEAQRIAHTLKGSGNIVGVSGIAVLTHHLEEILEYLTEHKTFPSKALAEILLESADCLEMMSDLMLKGESQPPEQALQVLQNVLNWANQIATSGLPSEDVVLEITALPEQPDTEIISLVQEVKSAESITMTRVPSEVIDKLLRMTGEGSILSEQFKERIKRFSNELKMLNELTWQIQMLVSELDQAINIQSYSVKKDRSVEGNEFDVLEMEQYNELHTAASRISEVATDIREINIHMDEQLVDLKYLMIEEDAIQKENQEMVQSIRMVPANTIASRCQRIVRQACRATNKEVELDIKGADILIDSEILNDMVDPLMHLLRNSIDHGIEPLHIREKYNKSKVGKITLEFSRKGNYAVISCKDDGGGLANGNILQTAIKKGLISAKQHLTDAEIHKLILIPGFSTRAVATQTSGRGIGMDAIQTKISAMQGQMSLSSVRGKGLTIDITVPLTLSSMLSLLIKCGNQTMAISNRGLRKIHHSDECILVHDAGQLFCDIDYKRYPAKYFAELVGMTITYDVNAKLPALRIEDEIGRTHIVLVDELLGYRDLLVKNMGSYIPHIQGITGASILGNGAVAPVIDLVEMLHHAAKYNYVLADATKALADNISGLPMALIVDDSLSARRAVAMLLKDSGIQVETAIDGLDAIKHIEKNRPDLLVVDLEMPRMNGIELTAHVRGREAMKDTPIIMITSRATEKHRKQAEAAGVTKFMTKPFTEDDLINNVRILMK